MDLTDDMLVDRARQIALEDGSMSVAKLQRRTAKNGKSISYTRASEIINRLVADGFLGDRVEGSPMRAVEW